MATDRNMQEGESHPLRHSLLISKNTNACWDQFPAMGFAQLTYRESLRDIEAESLLAK